MNDMRKLMEAVMGNVDGIGESQHGNPELRQLHQDIRNQAMKATKPGQLGFKRDAERADSDFVAITNPELSLTIYVARKWREEQYPGSGINIKKVKTVKYEKADGEEQEWGLVEWPMKAVRAIWEDEKYRQEKQLLQNRGGEEQVTEELDDDVWYKLERKSAHINSSIRELMDELHELKQQHPNDSDVISLIDSVRKSFNEYVRDLAQL